MAANNVRPKIDELTEHVNVGIKWNQVGIQLKLETKELDAIDAEHKRVADKVSAMYKLWLETNPNASRKQLLEVLRLKSINEITLAKNYEEHIIMSVTESITTQEEKKEETGEDEMDAAVLDHRMPTPPSTPPHSSTSDPKDPPSYIS